MTPTTKLRFVEREIETHRYSDYGDYAATAKVRILQQWWEDQSTDVHWVNGNPGKWRDVPLEVEE